MILVGGLVAIFYFPIHIGFMSSSQLTNSYFSEGWLKTTNQDTSDLSWSSHQGCQPSGQPTQPPIDDQGGPWIHRGKDGNFSFKTHRRIVGPPIHRQKLVQITAISLGFMVVITIITIFRWGYKPTYNQGAPHCTYDPHRGRKNLTFCRRCYLTDFLTYYVTFHLTRIWHSIWHIFWHLILHSIKHQFRHSTWHLIWHYIFLTYYFDHLSDILFGIFFWHSGSDKTSDVLRDEAPNIQQPCNETPKISAAEFDGSWYIKL